MKNILRGAVLSVMSILLIAGCGGGGSSDSSDDGSSVVSRGAVTGFGSVYVNGVRYHTGSTDFQVDDSSSSESNLKVGMIVTVLGNLLGSGDGIATRIIYDNELKGPVSAVTPDADPSRKTLTILGQSVLVTADTVINGQGGLSFDTLSVGDFLEVSGFVSSTGLIASYIELENNTSRVEIMGIIENLTGNSFTINGFPISYDSGTVLDDISTLSDGLFVEVEGSLNGAGTILNAAEIDAKNDFFDDDYDNFEVKGAISDYNASDRSFMLQGIRVDASTAVLRPASLQLANDVIVEAEGFLSNGVLVAREVKQRGRQVRIDAALSAVDTGASTVSFQFNGSTIIVRVNSGTEIEDDNSGNNLMLADLSVGHFVELRAFIENSGTLNAFEIERMDPDKISLRAPVDAFDEPSRSVTMLGIDFDLNAAIFEDDNDNNLSADQFFGALAVGRVIEIEDDDRNGVFEKAELED